MLFRMLELMYTPFFLLLISRGNKPSGNTEASRSTPARAIIAKSNNISECPLLSERNVSLLFYNHPDPEIRGCYEQDSKGPCGENMKLYLVDGTTTGECDCDITSLRMLLYHNETNQCYPIFKQAYCKPGEQLVVTRKTPLKPVCQTTACSKQLKDSKKDLVPIKSGNTTTCVEVGSTCGHRHIIGFTRHVVAASCIDQRSRAMGVPPVRCSPGTYRAITGHCQPALYSFDDDWD